MQTTCGCLGATASASWARQQGTAASAAQLRTHTRLPGNRQRRRAQRLSTMAAAQLKPLTAEAAAAAAEQGAWAESREALVQRLGLSTEDADSVLAEAFGWGSQAYWRQQKVQQPPSAAQVEQVLGFLAGLGIGDAELAKVVVAFPQVLGCELGLLEGNVDTLRNRWFLKGRVLATTIVRKPQVLGSVVDCEGSCIAECNRCWARF